MTAKINTLQSSISQIREIIKPNLDKALNQELNALKSLLLDNLNYEQKLTRKEVQSVSDLISSFEKFHTRPFPVICNINSAIKSGIGAFSILDTLTYNEVEMIYEKVCGFVGYFDGQSIDIAVE